MRQKDRCSGNIETSRWGRETNLQKYFRSRQTHRQRDRCSGDIETNRWGRGTNLQKYFRLRQTHRETDVAET